tara:strand:- start:2463 stop:3137 length:675 start_codon:yes stop_codon:yes gene_type:complete
MNKSLSDKNIRSYQKKYKSGYGINFPEGHIIRHSAFFRKKKNILDFGCGNGTHLKYFKKLKCQNLYGLETSSDALKRIKDKSINQHQISNYENLVEIFPRKKFDLIFSNQVLYYLDDKELKFYLKQFYKLLKKNGIIYITLMGKESRWFKLSKKVKNSSLRKIKFKFKGKIADTTYINFKNKKEIEDLFNMFSFKKVLMGYYDSLLNFKDNSSGTFHYIYVGKK